MEMTSDHITIFQYKEDMKRYERVGVTPNIAMMTVKEGKKKLLDIMNGFGIELSEDIKAEYLKETEDDNKRIIEDIPDVPF